jgi:hypothetical protein
MQILVFLESWVKLPLQGKIWFISILHSLVSRFKFKDVYQEALTFFYKVDDQSAINLDFKYFLAKALFSWTQTVLTLIHFKAREYSVGLVILVN